MANKALSAKEVTAIGLMLFALFFGAGNMIFPPFLGQQAGENVWVGVIGFLVTGVGLPLLGIIAIARSGGTLQTIASRVSPRFGVIFTAILYLAIGPFFGIPRTGTVVYEISVVPFLSENLKNPALFLFIFTFLFFLLTAVLSLNPTKLVDRIGKILTPILLVILAVLVSKNIFQPMGSLGKPSGEYFNTPFFKGFIEGYATMDTIAALVFGIVVVSSIKEKGIIAKKSITKICIQAGVIAAVGLGLVYLSLAYIGATSPEAIGMKDNGGAILSQSANYLYGYSGSLILALAIFFACITTSVGLVSASAQFFNRIMPKVSYKLLVILLSLFSVTIANIGLTNLIKVSLPVLIMIYPLAIVIILLSFVDKYFKGYAAVYICSLIPTGIISVIDGLKTAGFNISFLLDYLQVIPLFELGIGWLIPAIIGAIIGYFVAVPFGWKTIHKPYI